MRKTKKSVGIILLIAVILTIPTLTKAIDEEIWTNPEIIWQYIGELIAGSGGGGRQSNSN